MQHGPADHELPNYVYCTRLNVWHPPAGMTRCPAAETHIKRTLNSSLRNDSVRAVFIMSTLVTGVHRGTLNTTALDNQVFERNAMTEGSGVVKRISGISLESQMGWKFVS